MNKDSKKFHESLSANNEYKSLMLRNKEQFYGALRFYKYS